MRDPRHATSGFLSSLGVPPKVREPMPKQAPLGIACAACHAPHADHPSRALLRDVPFPATLGTPQDSFAASRVCMACHAPVDGETYPSASAAEVWLGPSADLAPHRAVPGGCVGCHAGPMDGGASRGTSHSFAADRERCKSCHAEERVEDLGRGGKRVRERAIALSSRLSTLGAPLHARERDGHVLSSVARDLALILEDPAAWAHNAPFARKVLDDAEDRLR
jgi:hypothetical protein